MWLGHNRRAVGLFVVAHLANANVDVFDSIGLVFAMIRFGVMGFHLGNGIAPLSREAGIGVTPKADVVKAYNAAGAFLATVATLVSVYSAIRLGSNRCTLLVVWRDDANHCAS
jgi:succinate dehydrogenase/fumarate reductase cytochrome b subunit